MSDFTPAERQRKIIALKNKINKKHKATVIATADEVPNTFQLRRPSGIMQLDIDTGGGLPAGGMSLITGPDSAGKTWLLYNYFRMHQALYGKNASILYGVVEFLPDYKYMRRVGVHAALPNEMLDEVDEDRKLRGLPKLTKQERASLQTKVGHLELLRAPTAEILLDTVLEAYDSRLFHIIAVDSFSVLQADAEAQKDSLHDHPQQAANASLMTRFMQRFHPKTLGLENANKTSLIGVAQARGNRKKSEAQPFMQKFMKDWAPSQGAYALRHGKLIDMVLHSAGKEKDRKTGVITAKTVRWELVKGKAGTHDNIVGETVYSYADPGDHISNLVFTGMKVGVFVEQGGMFTILNRATGDPLEVNDVVLSGIQGAQGLRNLFRDDFEIELRVRREILDAAGVGTCLYR